MTANDDLRWATAVHEAGHAVAAHVLGRGIRRATLEEGEDTLGHVEKYQRGPRWFERLEEAQSGGPGGSLIEARFRRAVERDVMIALAGGLAQREFLGHEIEDTGAGLDRRPPELAVALSEKHGGDPEDWSRSITGGDYLKCVTLVNAVSSGPDEASAYLDWLTERTKSMLAFPMFRPAVEAVAETLCRDTTLSGPRIKQVIETSWSGILKDFGNAAT